MEATLHFEEMRPKVQIHFCETCFGIYLYVLGNSAGMSLSASSLNDLVIHVARIHGTQDHLDEVKVSPNTTNN